MEKERILNELIERYKQKHKKSEDRFAKACRNQIMGGVTTFVYSLLFLFMMLKQPDPK